MYCTVDTLCLHTVTIRVRHYECSPSQALSGSAQGRANSYEALPNPTQQAPSNYTLLEIAHRTPPHSQRPRYLNHSYSRGYHINLYESPQYCPHVYAYYNNTTANTAVTCTIMQRECSIVPSPYAQCFSVAGVSGVHVLRLDQSLQKYF